jgi:glycosidase
MNKTQAPAWPATAVIYQVNLRALAAREPRNPVEALREKTSAPSPLAYLRRNLRALARLGWNTLYFLPPYPIGREGRKGIGSPYASADFSAVEPEYGTLAEMAGLVAHAHSLGLKVLFDITPNHTARDHVWMREHPDYYVRNPDGSAFYDCDWSDTAKLDYTNPAFRAAMTETLDRWLSFLGNGDGIDGFRFDMAHFINDRTFWNDALPELRRRHPDRPLLFLAECYGFGNNTDLFARGMDAAYDDDFYKFSQYAYARDAATGDSRLRLSPDAMHNGDWRPILDAWQTGGPAAAAALLLVQYEDAAPSFPAPHFTARYTDNHDEGRGLYRFGPGAVRAMMSLAFFSPRTIPFLLCGQEFGALNRPSIHGRCTPCDKGPRLVGPDGRETRLEGVEFEGNIYDRTPAARAAWYAFFRRLVSLRNRLPALSGGSFALLDPGEDASPPERTVLAFERTFRRQRVRFAVNLGDEPRRLANAALFRTGRPLLDPLPPDGILPPFTPVAVRL